MYLITLAEDMGKIFVKYWDLFLIEGLSATILLSLMTVAFGTILGAVLAAEAVGAEQIYICVNEDARDAISRLERSMQKYGKNRAYVCPINILPMKHYYPCGNIQMIKNTVAKKEKESIMVVSLAQMAALYDCIYDGEPWTKVGITVSGKVANPKNLWVPIGTNVKELIEYCGGM